MKSALLSTVMQKTKSVLFNRAPMMINCREFEAFLLDYLEGTLPARQRFIFEMHLKFCRECREYLAAYKSTLEVSKRLFTDGNDPVPDDVPEDLIRAILDARDK